MLFSNHILYDDVYYKTDADLFETFSPFINSYLSEHGYGSYLEEDEQK